MRRLFAAVGLVGFAAGVMFGSPPRASTPSELVVRLGADDFRERESAAAALEQCGRDAIPALRDGCRSEQPEVRRRAAVLLHKLQRAAASADRLIAKKLTLNYQAMPLAAAISDLKSRTGLNITLDANRVADPLRKITCATGELPTWDALDAFCSAAALKESFQQELDLPKGPRNTRLNFTPPPSLPGADAVPIVLIDGTFARLTGTRSGAVRVLALPSSFPGHRVRLGTGETTFCFDITPTPGLNWREVSAVKITKLVDDAGRFGGAGAMLPQDGSADDHNGGDVVVFANPGGFGGGRGAGRFNQRTGLWHNPERMPNPRVVAVPLKLATPTARSIKRLEGHILGEITLTNQTLITVADPVKHLGVSFSGAGDMRLTVLTATEDKGNGATMQLLLEYPPSWLASARRGMNPGGIWPEAPSTANQTPSVHYLDADGKPLPLVASESFTISSDNGQKLLLRLMVGFRKSSGVPVKLVVVGPRPMVVEVPFVMENVPLP